MKFNYKKVIVSSVIGCSLLTSNATFASEIQSGIYEQFIIAKTPDNKIQGYYYEVSPPFFKCTFYFEGEIEKNKKTPINSWLDESYSGIIEPTKDGVNLIIDNAQLHPGCMNLIFPEIATTGMEFSFQEKKNWIELAEVSAKKAVLRKTLDSKSEKGAYIVKGDVVGVLEFKDESAKVEFMNNGKSFIGWIYKTELEHFNNPKK